jgi:hypothetical protein
MFCLIAQVGRGDSTTHIIQKKARKDACILFLFPFIQFVQNGRLI